MIAIRTVRRNFFSLALPIFVIACVTIYKAANLGRDGQLLEVQDERIVRNLKPSSVALTAEPTTSPKPSTIVTENPLLKTHHVQEERQKLVVKICSQQKEMQRRSSTGVPFKLHTKYKYLYCPVPKAGWSSWKRLWFYAAGVINSYDTEIGIAKDDKAGVLDLGGEGSVQRAWKDGAYNYSFVFVRNPWERLVSAYINKAVEYNYSRILHTPCRWESMNPYKPDLTFQQFLTCIADGSREMHWAPQWSLCNVCRIKFDFIGHIETVNEDAAFVLSTLGINASYPHSFASKKYSTKKVMTEWYQTIPVDLLKRLQIRYRYDFELHGYSKQPPGRSDVI